MIQIGQKTIQIWLVRHGQTEGNKLQILQGQDDGQLSALGVKQAEALGKRIKKEHFDIVFVSDLARTKQTFELIQKHHSKQMMPMFEPLLREKHAVFFAFQDAARKILQNFVEFILFIAIKSLIQLFQLLMINLHTLQAQKKISTNILIIFNLLIYYYRLTINQFHFHLSKIHFKLKITNWWLKEGYILNFNKAILILKNQLSFYFNMKQIYPSDLKVLILSIFYLRTRFFLLIQYIIIKQLGVLQGQSLALPKKLAAEQGVDIRQFKPDQGESWIDVNNRAQQMLQQIIQKCSELKQNNITVLLVTHGGFIMEFMNQINYMINKKLPVYNNNALNCSITIVKYILPKGEVKIVTQNDASHIQKL